MKIRLHPVNTELEGDPNKSLLQICFDNKIELKSLCKGVPSCAECRVRVIAGESNLIPPNKAELNLIGTSYYIDGRRLACQIRAFGDISVDITDHLDKDDQSNKKIRGFRAQPGQHRESKAVQGTLVLQEGPEIAARDNRGPRPERGHQNSNPPNSEPADDREFSEDLSQVDGDSPEPTNDRSGGDRPATDRQNQPSQQSQPGQQNQSDKSGGRNERGGRNRNRNQRGGRGGGGGGGGGQNNDRGGGRGPNQAQGGGSGQQQPRQQAGGGGRGGKDRNRGGGGSGGGRQPNQNPNQNPGARHNQSPADVAHQATKGRGTIGAPEAVKIGGPNSSSDDKG